MKRYQKLYRSLLPVVAIILALTACSKDITTASIEPVSQVQETVAAATPEPSPVATPAPTPEPTPEPFEEYDISLMALGDNLMHMGIVYTGKQSDGSFDYSFLFQNLTDYLSEADIKVINQETIFGGNSLGFSGYPKFNSPTQVGDAIAQAGFNVVLHATNHAADQDYRGLKNTIDFWSQYPDVLMVGIKEKDAPANIPVIEIEGFKFAILNYTYGPNYASVPKEIRGSLNMLCTYQESNGMIDFTTLNPQVLDDIHQAKEIADMVLVFPHWGTEYVKEPSSYQKKFAQQMADAGADVIIGAHPHVPQPIEYIEAEDGHNTLVYYSLGNYVSTQKDIISMLEGMAWVNFHVTEDGIQVSETSGVIPLVCHYKSGPVRLENVYTLEEYTEEMAGRHGIRSYGGKIMHLQDLQNYSDEIFGSFQRKRSDILTNIEP